MANRFVSGAGSNTSPYETWAKAATTLTTAITGSSAGDVFVIDAANPGPEVGATTIWTFLGNATVIASTNTGISTITPTTMEAAGTWLGNSTTSYALTITGGFKLYFYGITFRTAGTGAVGIAIAGVDDSHYELDNCYIWNGTTSTSTSARPIFGPSSGGSNSYIKLKNCTLRFGATAQGAVFRQRMDIEGGSISSAGSAPTTLLPSAENSTNVRFFGVDLSRVTGTLVGSNTGSAKSITFAQCKLGAGVSVMATQAVTNKSSVAVYVFDCASGDTHGLFGYYDAFGSVTSDTGIYVTAGPAAQSWKIVTTANCFFGTPFTTPWIDWYAPTGSAITPSLEILRDGSTTAYTNAQVWAETLTKDLTGFTNTTLRDGRQPLTNWAAGTTAANIAAGAGLGAWTGESGTAWSGKIDTGAVTPAEAGDLRMRVCVGEPSITVYVNPDPRP